MEEEETNPTAGIREVCEAACALQLEIELRVKPWPDRPLCKRCIFTVVEAGETTVTIRKECTEEAPFNYAPINLTSPYERIASIRTKP